MSKVLGLLFCMAFCYHLEAQVTALRTHKPTENVQLLSLDLHAPIGAFAKSHIAGAGVNYTFIRRLRKPGPHHFTFTANGGADYYIGKKKEIAAHNFTYGGYLYIYAQGGVMTDLLKKCAVILTAGPSMGIYKGNSDFGVSSNLFGAFYVNRHLLIGPGVTFKKHSDVNALWTVAVRASYIL